MKKIPIGFAAFVAATLVLTGCSSGDSSQEDVGQPATQGNDSGTQQEPDSQEPQAEDLPEQPAASGDADSSASLGTVKVEDVTYQITTVRSCHPVSSEHLERQLELQGMGEVGGEPFQIDVYVQNIGNMSMDQVAWYGPEGVYGEAQDPQVNLNATGTNVNGVAELLDAETFSKTITVDFHLEIPTEYSICR